MIAGNWSDDLGIIRRAVLAVRGLYADQCGDCRLAVDIGALVQAGVLAVAGH